MNTSIIVYLDSLSWSKKPELLPCGPLLHTSLNSLLFHCKWVSKPSSSPPFCYKKLLLLLTGISSQMLSQHPFFARNTSPLIPCYWQISNTLPTQVLHHHLLPIVPLPSSVSPSKLMFPAARILSSLECFQSSEFETRFWKTLG